MSGELILLRGDVLDKDVLDRHGRRIGKVDDLLLDVDDDGTIRLAALVTGPLAYARTLGHAAASLTRLVFRALGAADPAPVRIPWGAVRAIGPAVQVEVDAAHTDVDLLGDLVYQKIIRWLPGA